jgi:hypothetical protein
MTPPVVDLTGLLKPSLVCQGEMDGPCWWNSPGMPGRHGAVVLARGFPPLHLFVQVRAMFAMARSSCNEPFSPSGCTTRRHRPTALEDQFDEHGHYWLDVAETWTPYLQDLAITQGDALLTALACRVSIFSRQHSMGDIVQDGFALLHCPGRSGSAVSTLTADGVKP